MNPNVEKLKSLKQDLDQVNEQHQDILKVEPTISEPLKKALDAASRRWGAIEGDLLTRPKPQVWE